MIELHELFIEKEDLVLIIGGLLYQVSNEQKSLKYALEAILRGLEKDIRTLKGRDPMIKLSTVARNTAEQEN